MSIDRQQLILQKLEKIQKEVEEIREHMVDVDRIMCEEDYEALLKFREEKAAGRLISHEQLKQELEL
ncbi:MAG: hypothetical protein KJ851_06305 [Nanoarchaeota archaeon]|nr:hypothetical protein [Nanoarchaeota archaeon]